MAKVLIFVYGELKSNYSPPDTLVWATPDVIYGDLYHLQEDAAAINIGVSNDVVVGETQEIDDSELPEIDEIEAPEYSRVQTVTLKGNRVFVYQYNEQLPADAYKVREWDF